MKSKNLSQYLTAVAVIGCSLVLLAALTFALSGYRWGGTQGRKLEVEFKDATGIKLHSSVRYAGAVAGTVTGIRFLKPSERSKPGERDYAVRVTIALNEDVPPLFSDLKASLSSETILGEKFVALSAGTPDAKPLADGSVIHGQSMSGIETLTQSLETTAASATELLQKFNTDYPELKTNLTRMLANGDVLLSTATNVVNDARSAIADIRKTLQGVDQTFSNIAPDATNLLAEAKTATTNLNRTLENTRLITADVQKFLTNQFLVNLDRNMTNLAILLDEVEITSEYAKILAARLAEKPSRLIWQIRSNKVPTEQELRNRPPSPPPPKSKK